MTQLLHCIQISEPACTWTGASERELIGHYLAEHHTPTAHDYLLVYEALRSTHREIEQLRAALGRAGKQVPLHV